MRFTKNDGLRIDPLILGCLTFGCVLAALVFTSPLGSGSGPAVKEMVLTASQP